MRQNCRISDKHVLYSALQYISDKQNTLVTPKDCPVRSLWRALQQQVNNNNITTEEDVGVLIKEEVATLVEQLPLQTCFFQENHT